MPYPNVTPLPLSPSRVTDPINFVAESAVFLNALSPFVTEVNNLASYVNSTSYNYNRFGTITEINPTKPMIPDVSGVIIGGVGVDYVSSIDATLAVVQGGSVLANIVGDYIDNVNALQGNAPSVDGSKPQLSMTSAAPTRAMVRSVFNTTSNTFITSSNNQLTTTRIAVDYIHDKNFGDVVLGTIIDNNIDEIIDCGTITDTNITL